MSSGAAAQAHWPTENVGLSTGKLGMWLFLASEVMFFTGLVGSYIVLRLGAPSWPSPGSILDVPALGINTFVLVTSSMTMATALERIRAGDQAGLRRYLAWTIVLGLTFLGIKAYDYTHLIRGGFTISGSLFGSCYFLLTGFHGLHVLAGIATLAWMRICAGRGFFSERNWDRIECVGLYWHFVDIVWIILFAILCLL